MRIIGNTHVKRALEIAEKGHHSILIIGNPTDILKDDHSLPANVRFSQLCPCGNFNDPRLSCCCSLETVKVYQSTFSSSEIVIELVRPTFNELVYEEIIPELIDDASKRLLETAYNKLSLNVQDIVHVLAVAHTIMTMDNELNLKAYHIAEAVQYKVLIKK
mgnify:CR=1 FL=1